MQNQLSTTALENTLYAYSSFICHSMAHAHRAWECEATPTQANQERFKSKTSQQYSIWPKINTFNHVKM